MKVTVSAGQGQSLLLCPMLFETTDMFVVPTDAVAIANIIPHRLDHKRGQH